MTVPASGTIVVKKSNGIDWLEETLDAEDIEAAKARDFFVLVKSLSDFPAPVANVITLEEDTVYEINGSVALGINRLVLEDDVTLRGLTHLSDSLSYTGTGNMITILNGSAIIDELKIDSPTTGSRAILFSGSLAAKNHLHLTNTHFGDTGVNKVALVQGGEGLFMSDCSFSSAVKSGITISGNLGHLFIRNCRLESNQSGCTYVTVQSGSYESILVENNHIDLYPSQTVFNIPNITTLDAGYIRANTITSISGGGTALTGGLNNNNVYWYIEDNEGLEDFKIFSLIKFVDNATATVVSSSATYYVAAGTNHASSSSQRFNISTNNRAIYIGRENLTLNALVTGAVSSSTSNETLRIALYKHDNLLATDTLITETEVRVITSNQSVSFALADVVSMKINDYLEVRVRNLTNTSNIIMEYMQLRIAH